MASVIGSVSIDDTQDVQDSWIEDASIEYIMELVFEHEGYSYVTISMDDVESELEAENFEFIDGGTVTGSIEIEVPMCDLHQALRDKVQALREEIKTMTYQEDPKFIEADFDQVKSKIAQGLAS